MRRLTALTCAVFLIVASCGSDGDDDEESGSDDTVAIPTIQVEEGEVDLDALNADIAAYIEASPNADAFSGRLEITAIEGDEVTLGPTAGEDISADEAETACEAMASIVYQSLPTAVITVEDASGAELASSDGPGGSCQKS